MVSYAGLRPIAGFAACSVDSEIDENIGVDWIKNNRENMQY